MALFGIGGVSSTASTQNPVTKYAAQLTEGNCAAAFPKAKDFARNLAMWVAAMTKITVRLESILQQSASGADIGEFKGCFGVLAVSTAGFNVGRFVRSDGTRVLAYADYNTAGKWATHIVVADGKIAIGFGAGPLTVQGTSPLGKRIHLFDDGGCTVAAIPVAPANSRQPLGCVLNTSGSQYLCSVNIQPSVREN